MISPFKLPVYPSVVSSSVGSIEISLPSNLSSVGYLLLGLSLETYTENNHTMQKCNLLIDLKTKKSLQFLIGLITRDYMGNTVMENFSKGQ